MINDKKVKELASHPGTFPEMVRATYAAGEKAGAEQCHTQIGKLSVLVTALVVALVVMASDR